MAEASGGDAAAVFDPLRPKLIRIAYRMLGLDRGLGGCGSGRISPLA